jgi:uncharacterized protein
MPKIDKKLYRDGIRFECTGCGECCRARHGYGYIYVTLAERRRLAQHLGLPTREFTRQHCEKTDDRFHLRDPARSCQFLDGARCTVYEARPGQCRTWPFWPENLNAKTWTQEVMRDCPGIGVGRLYPVQEIEAQLAEEKRRESQS